MAKGNPKKPKERPKKNQTSKRRGPKQPEEVQRSTIPKIWRGIVRVLSLVSIALALLVLFSYYKPVSLTPNEPLNESDPFSAPFTLLNDWYSPIYNITYECHLNRVRTSSQGLLEYTDVFDKRLSKAVLDYKEKADLFCPYNRQIQLGEIQEADISLKILFYVKFMPLQRSMLFNFKAAKDTRGKWRWLNSPIT